MANVEKNQLFLSVLSGNNNRRKGIMFVATEYRRLEIWTLEHIDIPSKALPW